MQLVDLLKIFWVSFAASAIVAWPIYRWLKSTVKQKIDPFAPEGHQLKQGTPTMGGLIVLSGALVGIAFYGSSGGVSHIGSSLGPLYALLLGFGLIGFVDDFVVPRVMTGKRGLGWKQKFLLEVLIAVLACWWGSGSNASWYFVAIGAFLVLFYSNAYNFADGLDGLSGSIWIGLTVGVLALAGATPPGQVATMAILGGVIAFLFLNAPPAKVFMGDVGSLPLGAVLGFTVFSSLFKGDSTGALSIDMGLIMPFLLMSVVMIAELIPVPMQVAYFKLTKGKRLFPMTPIHHAFEKKGWKESKVVWTFALVQLLLSLAAVSLLQSPA